MAGIIVNEDNTHYFITRGGREYEQLIGQINDWLDQYAETAVKELVMSVNAMRTSYASAVWNPLWEGYDPEGDEDQPFFAGADSDKGFWWKCIHSCWQHHRLGIDWFAHAIARARTKGISPHLSIRMNDVHWVNHEDHFMHSDFWRQNPQFRRVPCRHSGLSQPTHHMSWNEQALDYGHKEVRDYHFSLIREVIERYDVDGLELDWMRFGYHFQPGFEAQGADLLTAFTADVRNLLNHWSSVRQHKISLSARVPSRPQTAVDLGMDAVAWAQQGLIDQLVVTPFWETAETDMPIELWKRLLQGTGVKLAAGLEVIVRPCPDYAIQLNSLETVRGMAMSYLHRGADGIYLFNYMDSDTTMEAPENYPALLQEVGSMETMRGKPRRHVITYSDIWAVGERKAARLPALCKQGKYHYFRVHIGPKPDEELNSFVVIGAERVGDGTEGALMIRVNGELCSISDACHLLPPVPMEPYISFQIPHHALHDGYNAIELLSELEWKITWVEISFQ